MKAKKSPRLTQAAKTAKAKRAARRLPGGAHGAAGAEAARRARHLRALSRASGAERELEELVFGDCLSVEENELLRRLAGPQRVRNTQPWGPARTGLGARSPGSELGPGNAGCSLVFRVVPWRGKKSGQSPAIRRWKMKRKVIYGPKSRPGWMRMMKARKGEFRLGGGNGVSRLGGVWCE